MKYILLLTVFILSQSFGRHFNPSAGSDYSIVFGGCFQNDKLGLSINRQTIFTQWLVNNADAANQGNLSLSQKGDRLIVYYNGKEISRKAVRFDFNLELKLVLNGKTKTYKADLRRGKLLLFDYCLKDKSKTLTMEQVQEPVLL